LSAAQGVVYYAHPHRLVAVAVGQYEGAGGTVVGKRVKNQWRVGRQIALGHHALKSVFGTKR
jgi:hypothetical protein